MVALSGNHAGWLTVVAREVREAGKPVSLDFLLRVVPSQVGTARNDGHVTAAANGLDRNDWVAGQRLWVEQALAALGKANLVNANGDGFAWAAEKDGTWRVKFGTSTITVYGGAESTAARDQHMLGAATEPRVAKEPEVRPGYLLQGKSEVEVEVEVGVGDEFRKGRHSLMVHPLAFAIPPMSTEELALLRSDIEEFGVRMPLILYPDKDDLTPRGRPKQKVLDGRHRLYFASSLNKPVRVEIFEGTELAARQYVASLNLHRRHLTQRQRELAIVRLFGEQAKVEAKASQVEGAKQSPKVPTFPSEPPKGKEAYARTWELAGGKASGVTKNAVRQMMEVVGAPETEAKIDAGVNMTLAEARTSAREERGLPPETKQESRTYPTSVASELSKAAAHMQTAWDERDGPVGAVPAGTFRERLDKIDRLSRLLRDELERRELL